MAAVAESISIIRELSNEYDRLKSAGLSLNVAASTQGSDEKLCASGSVRLYPPLLQVLDQGDADMIAFDNKNPARLVDLIAVKLALLTSRSPLKF